MSETKPNSKPPNPEAPTKFNMDKAKTAVAKFLPSVQLLDLNNPKTLLCIRNYGIAAICLIITSIVVYKAITVPDINNDQFYLYAVFAVIPILVGTFVISPLFSENLTTGSAMLYGSVAFFLIVSMYLFYQILYPNSVGIVSKIMFGLFLLGLIVGLSILYKIVFRFIQNVKGWGGFVLRVIFFLPCLLIDFLETVFNELKSAPTMIGVLFVIEILIVLAYFYGPNLLATIYTQNAKTVLNTPVFLNKKLVIAKGDTFLLDPTDSLNPTGNNGPDGNVPTYRTNYSVSMWIYLNPKASNNHAYAKETTLFKYGLPSEKGKPQITYFNAVDSDPTVHTTDNYHIYYTNKPGPNDRFTVQMPGQSWNYIVLTYNDNIVDLFINGNLEKSQVLDSTMVPDYRSTDIMTVGEGDGTLMGGGLYGAIANVNYYTVPMSQSQVTSSYNMLRYKNPPSI
jgi:hypothetical protein